jgi:SAM-dependent methyltransferase
MHVDDEREHHFALCLMMGAMDFLQVKSVLDIGSGTGRAIRWIKKHRPDILVRGIEPVEELRKVAYANGVSETELIPGNALALEFADDAFDSYASSAFSITSRRPTSQWQRCSALRRKQSSFPIRITSDKVAAQADTSSKRCAAVLCGRLLI